MFLFFAPRRFVVQFVKKKKNLKTVAVTAAILCLVVCVCEAVDMCIMWHKSCGHVRHAHHGAQVYDYAWR